MKKQMKKTLALALVLCLMVSAVPVAALPVEAEKSSATQNQSAVTEMTEVTIVREEISLRGEYEKHFLMSDGTWSHKPGNTEVRNYDASGMIIYNPETADRNYPYADYDEFVGFFRVTPLNYINNTGLADIGQQSALETSSLAFELEKAELPDSSKASSVRIGMSYEEVTAILGKPQRQVTFGVMVVEYALSNGERFFVEYTQIGSVYEVCSYRLEA